MADAPPPPPRALMWLAAITALYTVVRLMDPPQPNASGQSSTTGFPVPTVPRTGSSTPLPTWPLADAPYNLALSFEDVEWFWAFHNRRELCSVDACAWTSQTRVALADLRPRLGALEGKFVILRPDRTTNSRFEIIPDTDASHSHPLYFITWHSEVIGKLAPPEPTVFRATPLPASAPEALAALLHVLGNLHDIYEGRVDFLTQRLQLDSWMREFEATASNGLQMHRCRPLKPWNASDVPRPSEGPQTLGTRHVDWLLHAALSLAVNVLEEGDIGGLGLAGTEMMWLEVTRGEFDHAFKTTPPEARPTAAAGLAGNLVLLESVTAAVLDAPAADLQAEALVWPSAWQVQARALRVLTAAEADPASGPLSDSLFDVLGVGGSVRGQLRRFLASSVGRALTPSGFFFQSLRAALIAMRTAAHMLRRGARLRDLMAVPHVDYDTSCCCSYAKAADPLRDLEFTLLTGEALEELIYAGGQGYDAGAKNFSALAAQAHKARVNVLRREVKCRFDAERMSESLADAVRSRSACLEREGLGGEGNETESQAPTFPVPTLAGMPEGRGTGIAWLNVMWASLVSANTTSSILL